MSVHDVRRRLTISLHRPFIDEMARRDVSEAVAVDALMLCDGNEQAVRDAMSFVGITPDQWIIGTDQCTRLLNHLRREGRQL